MTSRIVGLDIVRSTAILLVLWAHSTYIFSTETSKWLQSILPGHLGVPIFFVLSGYLIGGILLRTLEKTSFSMQDLWQFWIRRWFRTLPNYFLVVLVLLAYNTLIYESAPFSYRYLFFGQNLATPNPGFFPEAWSLSIEEWFYLSFPLLCYLGFKVTANKKRIVLILACFFILLPLLLRLWACQEKIYPNIWVITHIVIFRLDSLMYGILGAYLHRYKGELWKSWRYPGLVISLLVVVLLTVSNYLFKGNLPFWPVYAYSLESVITLASLPYFSTLTAIRSNKLAVFFTFISTISYAMYILNLSVIQWRFVPIFISKTHLDTLVGGYSVLIGYAMFWLSTVVGSYLLYRYFELPMMNLRDKIAIGNRVKQDS